jgi:dynein heavy chain
MLLTQSSGGGGGGKSEDEIMSEVATDILGKIPDRYDMEEAMISYPVKFEESMNTVLTMELVKFNRLLNTIELSLKQIGKAVKGEILMTEELDNVGRAMVFAQIPPMWKKVSYPSFKPLASYSADLIKRCEFFNDWLKTKPPSVFWVSSFFFTQAFLTGSKQNFARKYTIPIDAVTFDYEWMSKDHYKNAPRDGVYTKGLFLEAAKWDKKAEMLAESDPKVLYTSAPIILFKPLKKSDLNLYPHYECPLYMTDDRKGVLKTTGHSTNFVCFIRTPTNKPSGMQKVGGSLVNICEHWVLRGVALLTQLRD